MKYKLYSYVMLLTSVLLKQGMEIYTYVEMKPREILVAKFIFILKNNILCPELTRIVPHMAKSKLTLNEILVL